MIPYGRQTIEDDDLAAVAEVLKSAWLTQGPKVAEFEKALAAYCGVKHAVAVANGTVALQAAYWAAGLGEGDELVTSPLTFAATANAAIWLGAKVVFADVDPETGNLSVEAAKKALTSKTKIVTPVDYAGRPVDYAAFKKLGKLVVSDSCHSLGAKGVGQADLTVFSFHPVKSITTGEGGAVLTDDDKLAERLLCFRTHGITRRHPDWRYEIGELATNGRLTDIQSALGLSQLKKLDRFIARRKEIAAAYMKDLAGVDGLKLPPAGESAWHLFPVRVPVERRAGAFKELRDGGIGVQVHYIPVHTMPLFQKLGYPAKLCPNAEAYYAGELSLPIYPTLTKADRKKVVEAVKAVMRDHDREQGQATKL